MKITIRIKISVELLKYLHMVYSKGIPTGITAGNNSKYWYLKEVIKIDILPTFLYASCHRLRSVILAN